MSILKQVAVSGTVGIQVFTSAKHRILKSLVLTPSGANATVKIRDGQAPISAEIVFFGRAMSANGSIQFEFDEGLQFSRGLHVTVIGANAQAYLLLN
jgi:hypothetical protein